RRERAAFPTRRSSELRLVERVGFRVTHVVGDALVPIADEWTRGWAALEERAVKLALRARAWRSPAAAPWLELYARAEADGALARSEEHTSELQSRGKL